MNKVPFWRSKTLAEMSQTEWESLCDGCGKCCLHKLRYPDGSLKQTKVSCRLLDTQTCLCTNYARRKTLVPDCVVLTKDTVQELDWLPATCAYRVLQAGGELAPWHPLITGDAESVHRAGISVRGRCISERRAGSLENYIVG